MIGKVDDVNPSTPSFGLNFAKINKIKIEDFRLRLRLRRKGETMRIEKANELTRYSPYLFAEIDKKKQEMRKKGSI
jgi:hypothetical protein